MGSNAISSDIGAIAPRESFNQVAQLYDAMRPGYPEAVFADVIAISGIRADARLLEIGCGTGHATLPFAQLGFRVDCVELGENMAAIARQRLSHFHDVTITIADFDSWNTEARYELAYSATAYHWLNPATRIQRIAGLIQSGGWLAVWRNHHVRSTGGEMKFHEAARKVYAEEAPALAAKFTGLARADEIPHTEKEEWLASGFFRDAETRVHLWQKTYSARDYVHMLDTHSDHRMLPESIRKRIFEKLTQLVCEFGGSVVNEYATILQMARKKS